MNRDEFEHAPGGFIPVGLSPETDDVQIVRVDPGQIAVFYGRPTVFFLAVCEECNEGRRPVPMPFGSEADRDIWANGHRTTGHTVNEAMEIRT